MTLNVEALAHYQTRTEALASQGPSWLSGFRLEALKRFTENGFPSPREEDWKYTNVAPIERKRFPLAESPGRVDETWVKTKLLPDCWHLVLIDGHFTPDLSHPAIAGDVVLCDWEMAQRRHNDLLARGFGRAIETKHGFIDFNTALFQGGVLIYLTATTRLEHPIQILHLQTQATAAPTRHLIVLEEHAEATVIESHAGTEAGLSAHVSEVQLGCGARLEHFKLQEETERAFHFGGLYVKQASGSSFNQTQIALGGFLARSEIHARLGQGCETNLNGLHWANGRRHLDSHTRLIHTAPNGTSRETYKAIAEEHGRSVFEGRIIVQPGAQKTDAVMNNRNLLLSDDAEIDSKPQLEIDADDVRCAHGVTVGQLDPDALFYLETRGIDAEAARQLLLYGFVNELVEAVNVPPLRHYLHQQLDRRFNAIELEANQ